ncbi:endonuclease YncB(thermonuclease family) [Hydrogenophaga palleronii]|uniref:Endonuclease YncB(Thermonuclease family) n=1 Tax=Hydrogenophaga palleronii TaxID=65655 RepID=A0ABU1WGJ6_9BURK|nr:thermonuclease family protein [Hydrogenophaga palleronii]MDR7148201.1 endonuclease YncB(thermonuclease family) [Hydrogenophaga palleronii]
MSHFRFASTELLSRPWSARLLLFFGLSLAVALASASDNHRERQISTEGKVYLAKVTRVFDGDTLWVRPLAGGRYRKLRLDGIDAPEICQAGGVASRDALATMVTAQEVRVEVRRYDDYGRALVRLSVDGVDVSARLVGAGHAWSYRWRRSLGPYAKEEEVARKHRRGIFSGPTPELPRDFRRRHGPCPLP